MSSTPTQTSTIHLKSNQSLERLRERVLDAAQEVSRLRQENAYLQERLRVLEATVLEKQHVPAFPFEEDPAVLRRKIEGFIASIDQYLNHAPPNQTHG